MIFALQWIYGQDPPVEFTFNQSTLQAFYFFNSVTINGAPISSNDWVAAFNGDICVGTRQWDESNCGGSLCDVPVMGDDGSEYTAGYIQTGDIPTFKIYDASSGNIYDASPSEPVDAWSISELSMNDVLEVEWSVNEADYQYNGSITTAVDFNDLVEENDMIAVLVDYEIRGIGTPEIFPPTDEWVFQVMVHSNVTSGEFIEFVYYNSSSEDFIKFNESHEFISDMIIGNAMDPFMLTSDYCPGDIDACGVCGGDGSDDLGCGCFEPGPSGCDNTCGSTLDIDACGVCGGDGSDDLGCGCFEPGPSGCDNTCGSTLEFDECGICDGGGVADGACDCDGNIEDVCSVCGGPGETTWYPDTDEDGLGDPNNSTTNCEQPEGYVADNTDSYPDCTTNIVDNCGECDGNNSTCTGCEDEVACNTGEENECVYASTWYADTDEDGLGDPNNSTTNCEQPNGYVADNSDSYPDCTTNIVDNCGECNGDNTACLGCTNFESTNFDPNATIDDGSCDLSIDTHYINNFSINSIYPNPFNPVVNIDLSIDIVGHLQLSVFTVDGTQIKTIYNGPSSIGESTFTWVPKNRASGFYFINAILDDRVKTQKVLFLK